jgi:hypothetical protein
MARITNHAPGSFCWAETGTTGIGASKAFYSELLGWTFDDRPAGDAGVYSIARLQERDICGMYELSPLMREQGVRPHWMPYIAVQDADVACRRAGELGGTVLQGPFDVADVGRMAVLVDPTGAHVSIWGAKAHKGSGILGEPGTPCWFELATGDLARAEAFYTRLFGWALKGGSDGGVAYHEITNPGSPFPMGGITELGAEHDRGRVRWKVYFMTEDVDGDARRAVELGGRLVEPALDIPGVGRSAVLADPAGASFALFKLGALG